MIGEVFALFMELSDQYGTSMLCGVFSSREGAQKAEERIRRRRTYIRVLPLDELDLKEMSRNTGDWW